MGYEEIEKKAGSGFFWKIMENGGTQGVQFLISLVLARLLSPKEYGTLAILSILVTLANVLIQNGFATSLIQKKEADALDFSSVLYCSLFLAGVLYLLLFLLAPRFAVFFGDPEMVSLVRVLLLVLFPGGLIAVQHAYIARNMAFRYLFEGTLLASLFSGGISIFLALGGFKVWALVWQQLVYYLLLAGFLSFRLKGFFGKRAFSPKRLGALFSFGSRILAASLLDTLFTNLYSLAIGKAFSQEILGNYYRGEQFPKLITGSGAAVIQSVLLPLMSAKQAEKKALQVLLSHTVRVSAYIIFPMMGGMAAAADRIILVLLGEQWRAAIPFLVLLALAYGMWPLHICNLQAIAATGRSDIFLWQEVIKKLLGLAVLALGICWGMLWLVVLKAVSEFLGILINAWPNRRLLSYGPFRQMKEVFPSFFLTLLMGASVWGIGRVLPYTLGGLLLQIGFGMAVYILLSLLFRLEEWSFLRDRIRNAWEGRKGRTWV